MALRPEDRYASARALAEDVEHWLADEPVSAWREPLDGPGPAVGQAPPDGGDLGGGGGPGGDAGPGLRLPRQGPPRGRTPGPGRGRVGTLIKAKSPSCPRCSSRRSPIGPGSSRPGPAGPTPARPSGSGTTPPGGLRALDASRLDDRLGPLLEAMLRADPSQLPAIRDALAPRADSLAPRLWRILEDPGADPARRFNAACALATYEPPTTPAARARWSPSGPSWPVGPSTPSRSTPPGSRP